MGCLKKSPFQVEGSSGNSSGQFEIVAKVVELNYRVHEQGKKKPYQIYHMHLLKSWNEKELVFTLTSARLKSQVGVDNVQVASTLSKSPYQGREGIFGKDHRDSIKLTRVH